MDFLKLKCILGSTFLFVWREYLCIDTIILFDSNFFLMVFKFYCIITFFKNILQLFMDSK